MSYNPKFIVEFEKYNKEKQNIKTFDDWQKFNKKWFDKKNWPQKTSSQFAEDSKNKISPCQLGGRLWGYTTYIYDITPEARYEMFSALRNLGEPLIFTDENNITKTAEYGWSQDCPYCEISTTDIGDDICPKCGRKLLYDRVAD